VGVEQRVVRDGDIAGGEDVRVARGEVFVDDNPVVDSQSDACHLSAAY
jgi:hypothetical protein